MNHRDRGFLRRSRLAPVLVQESDGIVILAFDEGSGRGISFPTTSRVEQFLLARTTVDLPLIRQPQEVKERGPDVDIGRPITDDHSGFERKGKRDNERRLGRFRIDRSRVPNTMCWACLVLPA